MARLRIPIFGLGLAFALSLCATAAAAADEAGEAAAPAENPLPRARWSTGVDAAMLAPIGLPDATTLDKGEWSLSYRYDFIHFDDMRNGTSRNSTDTLLQVFDETPRKRDLQIHTFGVAYAPHRRVTLSARLPVITQKTHLIAGGPPRNGFETESKGVGDLELRVLIPFMRKRSESLQVEFGLTAPTGSISERDRGDRLSYPQQLGSGTVDMLTGIVYRGRWETLTWGFAARSTFRFYENKKDYRLGHQHILSTWVAQSWTDWMSTSLRMSWQQRLNAHPADRTAVNPELDPKRQGGEFIDLGPGVNFRLPWLGDPRFGVEMTWPFFQTLDGPQLERDWQLTAGWEWAF